MWSTSAGDGNGVDYVKMATDMGPQFHDSRKVPNPNSNPTSNHNSNGLQRSGSPMNRSP